MPVVFQPHVVVIQPLLHENMELPQLALIRPEDGEIVHIATVVLAVAAVTNHLVERLQNSVGEPLRCVRPDLNAVFDDTPDKVESASVLDELPHTLHDDLRLQTFIEMPDVAAELIFGAFRVSLHPLRDGFSETMRAAITNAAAAVEVHAAHECGLHDLNQSVMYILVRPLHRLTYSSPLAGARVPPAGHARLLRLVTGQEYLTQLGNALILRFLHPCRASIGTMMRFPMVGSIHLTNGEIQIFI